MQRQKIHKWLTLKGKTLAFLLAFLLALARNAKRNANNYVERR